MRPNCSKKPQNIVSWFENSKLQLTPNALCAYPHILFISKLVRKYYLFILCCTNKNALPERFIIQFGPKVGIQIQLHFIFNYVESDMIENS